MDCMLTVRDGIVKRKIVRFLLKMRRLKSILCMVIIKSWIRMGNVKIMRGRMSDSNDKYAYSCRSGKDVKAK